MASYEIQNQMIALKGQWFKISRPFLEHLSTGINNQVANNNIDSLNILVHSRSLTIFHIVFQPSIAPLLDFAFSI